MVVPDGAIPSGVEGKINAAFKPDYREGLQAKDAVGAALVELLNIGSNVASNKEAFDVEPGHSSG